MLIFVSLGYDNYICERKLLQELLGWKWAKLVFVCLFITNSYNIPEATTFMNIKGSTFSWH